MSFLDRLFGIGQQALSQMTQAPQAGATPAAAPGEPTATGIPAERVGLAGEFDQSGMAKRVAAAFDTEPELRVIETVWVAQTGSTVVLKGKVTSQRVLDRMEAIAKGVNGARAVDSSQVQVQEGQAEKVT